MPPPRFRTIQNFKSDFCESNFSQYESTRTGLRVVVVHQQTPKIWSNLIVATEIHDDSGAPHTLEHLIFTASRSYVKGFLDRLATRSYGETNAYTDIDRTVYQLESAGWDGFAQTLPVFLEHLILPTLSNAACYTEVHHIDGTGHDAGVVYSEMQGRENTLSDLQDLKMKRQLYPQGVGFRYEVGGLMENLRVLTNQRIRAFHKEMYQPKNICVAIVGDIDDEKLLETLDAFEDTIEGLVPRLDEPFGRPWEKSGKTPKIAKPLRDTVDFPEADEEVGQIQVSYLGPDCNDELNSAAMSVFTTYLSGGPIALLDKTIVEEEQLASSIIVYSNDRPDTTVDFYMGDVKTEDLNAVADRFLEILRDAAKNPLDMAYLKDCLRRVKRWMKFNVETSPETWLDDIATDHVFGKRDGSGLRHLASIAAYDKVERWAENEWIQFFRKWFIDSNSSIVLAKPSKALSEKLEKDEEARVTSQKEKLGDAALKDLADKLDAAKKENDVDIPKRTLQKFPIPPADSIAFIETQTARAGLARHPSRSNGPIQKIVDKDDPEIPLFLHFEHVKSNFVTVGLMMNTHCLPDQLKPLIPIFILNFFGTPVARDGKRIEFEEAVGQLERETVTYYMTTSDVNEDLFHLCFQVEPDKYKEAIGWIKTMLFDSIFDETRLISGLKRLIGSLSSEKRAGEDTVLAMANLMHSTRANTARSWNTLIKGPHYKQQLIQLQNDPKGIIEKLEALRQTLMKSASFRCYALGDFESDRISKPVSDWKALSERLNGSETRLAPLDSIRPTLSEKGMNPGNLTLVMPMRTIDSSFVYLYGRGIGSHSDPRLPALSVAQAYLEVIEGPLWNAVRGNGLAYGTYFRRSIQRGILSYNVYRSPDAYKAFNISKNIIADFVSGKTELDDLRIEDAISNIVKGVANEGPSMLAAATTSFTNQVVLDIPKDWSRQFAKQVQHVRKDDIIGAVRDFMLPLFDPSTANVYVTCAPVMVEKLIGNLKEAGFPADLRQWSDFRDDYGIDLGDADDEGLEDEVDGDDEETDEDED